MILATHPHLLHEAQKAAISQHAEIQDAAELPPEIDWPEPLPFSPRNVYGVMPANMNSWEVPFAELLDRDVNNVVLWWHRNLPHKPWSVNVLMPDGRGFYPDFIIGVAGRPQGGPRPAGRSEARTTSATTRPPRCWPSTAATGG